MIRIFSRSLTLLATLALFAGTLAHAEDYVPTVLVTGANRGIGLELTRQYAARGWKVIATARKPAEATELDALAAESEGRVSIEALDVTDLAAIDALAAKYQGQPVDVLFNNAGITGGGNNQLFGKKMEWPLYEQVLRTNVIGPLKMAEAFLPHVLASQQEKISNVSSSQGSIGSMNNGMLYFYRPSKAALNMEMRNLSIQLRSKGVSVALIDPGPVDTDMMSMLPKRMLRPVETAGSDLIRITDQLSIENTGTFWTFDGTVLPW